MEIKQKPSPNFNNTSYTLDAVVLHTTLGAFEGAVDWLRTSPEERLRKTGVKTWSSAHFVISRIGEIAQLVQLDKASWHAGAKSNMSSRAKAVIKKNWFGTYINPNLHTIGIEFASGYDIDRDGILETWEKLYTPLQVKAAAWLILYCEKELGIKIPNDRILTHKDIASYKPDLELQRIMTLSSIDKLRAGTTTAEEPEDIVITPEPVLVNKLVFEHGDNLKVKVIDGKVELYKI